ncbi:MAG: DUF1508 domain-containing protein [Minisyncoccia bacterium]
MAKTTKFEVYKDKKGGFRWRLLSSNGEAVAVGEAYKERRGVMDAIKKLKDWASTKVVSDLTVPAAKPKVAKKK